MNGSDKFDDIKSFAEEIKRLELKNKKKEAQATSLVVGCLIVSLIIGVLTIATLIPLPIILWRIAF